MNNKISRYILPIVLTIFISNIVFDKGQGTPAKTVPLSQFISEIEINNIKNARVLSNAVVYINKDNEKSKAQYPENYSTQIIDKLNEKNISFDFISPEANRTLLDKTLSLLGFLISWLPMFLISMFIMMPFLKSSMTKKNSKKNNNNNPGGIFGGGNPFSFGKSKAKAIMPEDIKVKFSDVQGIDEAKEELVEIVDFLKNPKKYSDLGGKIPKGCLLNGDPGTGKTMLAKAIASEAKVPFFFISGSDFVEMFVGVGASRVRDMFEQAKKSMPCIIFIDEIDAVGRQRGSGQGGGNDEREQTLNQLLVEMDGFEENAGIIVLAATNRPDILDKALLRPGRFDRQISIPLPDIAGRSKILKAHAKKIKSKNLDLDVLARGTPGFSGADLANLINESALISARKNKRVVTITELEEARDRVLMGLERKSAVMKEAEKKLTAYHEGGHAIMAIKITGSDPIHKATIIPRGRALGLVMRLPVEDKFSITKENLIADLAVAMGGRAAEEIIFGENQITTGASSDIRQATNIARSMIVKWGFSETLGKVNYDCESGGYSNHNYHASEETIRTIDREVKELVESSYTLAKKTLNDNIKELHLLSDLLLKYETLTGDEIKDIVLNFNTSFTKDQICNEDVVGNKVDIGISSAIKSKSDDTKQD